VTAVSDAVAIKPGRVLRLALVAWGLGDLALGRRASATAWLVSEILGAALVAYLFIGLADTTWYLVPFLAGVLFLIAWATQAAIAYRAALRERAEADLPPSRAAAAAMAWLTIPLLVWGTGFWLASGSAAGPAAALDRFESSWPALAGGGSLDPELQPSAGLSATARLALGTLQRLCSQGALSSDCSTGARSLLRDVRISLMPGGHGAAIAMVTVVSFERRPSRFMGIFAATELVPVPQRTLLTLHLRAVPAPLPGGFELGAERWRILGAASS
jgi:hypothetical protein